MLKRHLLPTIAIVALGLAGCTSGDNVAVDDTTTTNAEGGYMAQDGDLVEVHYSGTLDDGSTFDSSRERGAPLPFTVGAGEVIPGFDEAVRGLAVGESRTVRILPTDAYGEWSEDLVVEVPIHEPGRAPLRTLLGWHLRGQLVVRPGRDPRLVAL